MKGIAVGSGEMQISLVNYLNQSKIHPIIDKSFKFEELAMAFQYQESGAHFGKISILFNL